MISQSKKVREFVEYSEYSAVDVALLDESVHIPHQLDKFWVFSLKK
jgi:hypothetical protein